MLRSAGLTAKRSISAFCFLPSAFGVVIMAAMVHLPWILAAILIAGCAAVRQQKALPPQTDDYLFKNLQIFPPNIPRDELITTMKGYSRALGVRCEHCHVKIAEEPKEEFDFASDAKPGKAAARVMIRMTERINRDYVSKIEEMYTTVTCWTCHRGEKRPAVRPSSL